MRRTRSHITRAAALFAVVASLLVPSLASAETAEEANARGVEAYQKGDFEAAGAAFRQAWELSENPAARKNEAIAWFKARKCEPAVEAASSFLTYGEGTFAEFIEVNSVVGNCKAQLAREAANLGDVELARKLLDEARYLQVDGFAREQINLAGLELARAGAGSGARSGGNAKATGGAGRPVWAKVLFGAGVATVGAALVYHLAIATTTKPNLKDRREAGLNDARSAQLVRRVKTSNWLLPTLYVVGLAATATGGYFLFVAPTDSGAVAGLTLRF